MKPHANMASALEGFDNTPGPTPRRDALLDGYRRGHSISGNALRWLDIFIAARDATLVLWCRSSPWTYPKFPAAPPRWREHALPKIRLRLDSANRACV